MKVYGLGLVGSKACCLGFRASGSRLSVFQFQGLSFQNCWSGLDKIHETSDSDVGPFRDDVSGA